MCSEKRPALCVVNLYLLLGQLDVHLLSDELRRNAVAMSPVGPAQPDAMAFVHGVDLPFAMFIGTIRQRLQAAPFLFFETGPTSGISSLPLTQVEFVQVFENQLAQVLSVLRQSVPLSLKVKFADNPTLDHINAGFHAIFVFGMMNAAGLCIHAIVFT